MNKNFIKNDDGTVIVSTDNGCQYACEVNKDTSNETVNNILVTENEIEYLEQELWSLKCSESDIGIKNSIAKGMYFAFLPLTIGFSTAVLYGSSELLTLLTTNGIITGMTILFNISMTGTFLGRKHKLAKIDSKITETESNLAHERQIIAELKAKTDYKESNQEAIKTVKPIDRTNEPITAKIKTLIKK